MARVDAFNKGKETRDDEYYTQLADIENELKHYRETFKGKTILCNCDDPYESNFFKYFAMNFNFLGLKKLIATCYVTSPVMYTQLSLFDDMEQTFSKPTNSKKKPYKVEITDVSDENGDGSFDLEDIKQILKNKKNVCTILKGDGDFRSEECIELLKDADIVVTNPPFSLFREYIDQLMSYKKSFLIIGRETSITYKDTFKYITENKAWYGYTHAKNFIRPDGSIKSFGNVTWFTNIDVSKRHDKLIPYLYKTYNPNDYPSYYNYDGIDVGEVSEIPLDYYGCMGVPLSFLNQWNPDEFEIIGMGQSVPKKILHQTAGDEIHFIDATTKEIVYRVPYTVPERKRGNQLRINENNTPGRVPFGRLVIRRKEQP